MITVIIPVYNVQDYLARCVDSVLSQSYRELEIILVDDGSTDGSGAMCDDYASRDNRIVVVHKANGGLSDARNAGLDVMRGDYVTFVDADDYIHPQFAQVLLDAITRSSAQIAVCRWQELNDGQSPRPVAAGGNELVTFTQEAAINSVFYQRELTHSACSRLFAASIFSDIRFPVGKLYEDLAVIYPILKKVETVVLAKPAMYYYMHRPGSIITTMSLSRAHVLEHLELLEEQVSCEAPQYLPAVCSRHMSACFNMLRLMPLGDPAWAPVKEHCWQYIKNMRKLCITDRKVRFKNKVAIVLSYFGIDFLLLIINKNRLKR